MTPVGSVTNLTPHAFELNDADFDALRALVKQLTGISLGTEKRALIHSRLSRRLRALGFESFGQYRECLAKDTGAELGEFRNAVTTNLTSFFREPHHFDYLSEKFLRPRMSAAGASRRIRIWSAGCSTGEEPYSIAMTVVETMGDRSRWDLRILGTDLDSQVLTTARDALYTEDRLRGVSRIRRDRFFTAAATPGLEQYQVTPELRELITLKQLNLMDTLPMKGPLDVIFCRNVVIYFDRETQQALFARMARLQRAGDLLFVGHSENIVRITDAYRLMGHTVYQRI